MRANGRLLNEDRKHVHSYMHCGRNKTPVILRATTKWFAAMDEAPGYGGARPSEALRTTALRGIEESNRRIAELLGSTIASRKVGMTEAVMYTIGV